MLGGGSVIAGATTAMGTTATTRSLDCKDLVVGEAL